MTEDDTDNFSMIPSGITFENNKVINIKSELIKKQETDQPKMLTYKYSVILETKHFKSRSKRSVVYVRSYLSYSMQNTNGKKCEKLCYSGQKCQRIPEALVKLYGPKIQSLDLSYNELVNLKGLDGFSELKELVLDNNQLTDSLVIPYLPYLQTLSMNKNKITDLESLLLKISQNLPNLSFLSLLGNKACPNELSGLENDEKDYQRYRYFVLYHIPYLKFLDSNRVTEEERREGRKRGKFMNIIRPKLPVVNDVPLNTPFSNSFTPLPRTLRSPEDHRGAYGKCKFRYSGKHSEGNRFICNEDL